MDHAFASLVPLAASHASRPFARAQAPASGTAVCFSGHKQVLPSTCGARPACPFAFGRPLSGRRFLAPAHDGIGACRTFRAEFIEGSKAPEKSKRRSPAPAPPSPAAESAAPTVQQAAVDRAAAARAVAPAAAAAAPATPNGGVSLDPLSPAELLRAWVRMRGSLDPTEEVVFYFRGTASSLRDGEPSRLLFNVEGYNIARFEAVEGGYRMLTRELLFFRDPATNERLDAWTNPWNGAECQVLHIANDPVNLTYLENGPWGPFALPHVVIDGHLHLSATIFLHYPSPLTRAEYPRESQSDTYQAGELFNFVVREEELAAATDSVPSNITWTRISPYMPWMLAGEVPGHLVFHCSGAKLRGGFAGLPARLRAEVHEGFPSFARAPAEFTTPNETSLTYFKRHRSPSPPPPPSPSPDPLELLDE